MKARGVILCHGLYSIILGGFKMIMKKTIKVEGDYDGTSSKRYYLSVDWDKEKPCAVVIMLSAGKTNGVSFDRSTNYCLENLVRLGYGKMIVVNMFANIGDGKSIIEDCDDEQNLKAIKKFVSSSDVVIYAVGTGKENNQKFQNRKKQVLDILSSYEGKLFCISDDEGKKFYHPLYPKAYEWNLVEVSVDDLSEKAQR